jgi:hypothetical protein
MRSRFTRILLLIGLTLSLFCSGCGSPSDVLVVKNGTLVIGDGW